jgi:hypothetical protein
MESLRQFSPFASQPNQIENVAGNYILKFLNLNYLPLIVLHNRLYHLTSSELDKAFERIAVNLIDYIDL